IGVAGIAKGSGDATVTVRGTVDVDLADDSINTLDRFGLGSLALNGSFGVVAISSGGAATAQLDGGQILGETPDYGLASIVDSGTELATADVDGTDAQVQINANLVGVLGLHNGEGDVLITETPF